jgi:RNA recognition motif-containing protein
MMADGTLKSVFGAPIHSETKSSIFNKNSSEFRPLFASGTETRPTAVISEDEYFSTMGSALDELLSEMHCKYQETPSESPMPVTAHATPQMSASFLPPPPGYDPIVEGNTCFEEGSCDPSIYSSPTYSYRAYPPPFHLGHKLFVGALPYSVSEADLFPLFSQFGEILELHIQRDWLGRSKGCAWLRYSSTDECDAAIDSLHNNYYLGSMNRPLQLTYASDKVLRPRTASMNEEFSLPPQQGAARSRAMTEQISNPSIPTPSSSVLGKLRQMMSSNSSQTESASLKSGEVTENVSGTSPAKEDTKGTTLYVSGFPVNYTDDQIKNMFNQFGPLMLLDRSSQAEAIVEFQFPSDADRAKSVINGVIISESCETPLTVLSI